MRVRLVSGGFGFMRTVTVQGATPPGVTFFVPQPPALADLRIGYAWQNGPIAPERVAGLQRLPLRGPHRAGGTGRATRSSRSCRWRTPRPGCTSGFDRPLPVDNLGLFFDIVEEPAEALGPTLVWEYWDGFEWRAAERERRDARTCACRASCRSSAPRTCRPLARFGSRPPLAARPLERGRAAGRADLDAPAAQRGLGGPAPDRRRRAARAPATGQPGQVFAFRQVPCCPGQQIEVRELAGGARERRVADPRGRAVRPSASRASTSSRTLLAAEGERRTCGDGPLRLRRDRLKQRDRGVGAVGGAARRCGLRAARPALRLDRARGRLLVSATASTARVPPLGADDRRAALPDRRRPRGQRGRGAASARSLGPVGGVEEVVQPGAGRGRRGRRDSGAGGRAGAAPASATAAAPSRPPDYETLAREASPSVAVARAMPGSGRRRTGRARLGHARDHAPQRRAAALPVVSACASSVRRFIEERAPADLAAAAQIVVTGPRYQPVDVAATLVVRRSVEGGSRRARGARRDRGLPAPAARRARRPRLAAGPGRLVSDLARGVERVDGLDHARELALLQGGVVQGESLPIAADRDAGGRRDPPEGDRGLSACSCPLPTTRRPALGRSRGGGARADPPVRARSGPITTLSDPGITFAELFAWIAEMQVFQVDQVPARHRRKFLALLGVRARAAAARRGRSCGFGLPRGRAAGRAAGHAASASRARPPRRGRALRTLAPPCAPSRRGSRRRAQRRPAAGASDARPTALASAAQRVRAASAGDPRPGRRARSSTLDPRPCRRGGAGRACGRRRRPPPTRRIAGARRATRRGRVAWELGRPRRPLAAPRPRRGRGHGRDPGADGLTGCSRSAPRFPCSA